MCPLLRSCVTSSKPGRLYTQINTEHRDGVMPLEPQPLSGYTTAALLCARARALPAYGGASSGAAAATTAWRRTLPIRGVSEASFWYCLARAPCPLCLVSLSLSAHASHAIWCCRCCCDCAGSCCTPRVHALHGRDGGGGTVASRASVVAVVLDVPVALLVLDVL